MLYDTFILESNSLYLHR